MKLEAPDKPRRPRKIAGPFFVRENNGQNGALMLY